MRQVENQLAELALVVLWLHGLHADAELICDLSRPHACIVVHGEQVVQHLGGVVKPATDHTSSPEQDQHVQVLPQAGEIAFL